MSSAIAILEKLLEDETVSFKEHVLETASTHVSNVQQRFESSFDSYVRDISAIWGEPEFNSQIRKEPNEPPPEPSAEEEPSDNGEHKKKPLSTVVPNWCKGTARNGGEPKALRLAHWKKPDGLMYIVLRTEVDPKKNDRPIYYDLVLGARRRKQEVDKGTVKLRQTKEHWMAGVVGIINYWFGRR